jgi:hypothetical protein
MSTPDDIECNSSLTCPECGQAVEPPADVMQNVVVCPHCHHQFFIDTAPPPEDDDEAAREAAQREIERAHDLDNTRIRALSAERRAMVRQRSYCITAVGGCVLAIGQSMWWLVSGRASVIQEEAKPLTIFQQACLIVLMAACVMMARFFWRKAQVIRAELAEPVLTDPTVPPEFDSLGQAKSAWEQLEDMNKSDEV